MLDSLRLPVEDAVEATVEILAEVFVELAGKTKLMQTEPKAQVKIQQLKAQVEIQQLKELKVLLVTICY